ncbi:hypothetical protein ACIBCP_25805 [Streptomyces sp. NPDC051287]|uniref:hypothetical protein n=1 Tax=Streptomyces sp. NPDC051287 TaxID=3365648 RepID=UPI00379A22AB
MNYQPVAAAVVAVCGVIGLVIQGRRSQHVMNDVKRDLEVLALLPEGSEQRASLQLSIEGAVARYVADQRDKTRDWSGVAVALFLATAGAFLWWLPASNGGYWWWCVVGAIPFSLFGFFGFFESIARARRDSKGIRIKDVADDAEAA